MSLPHRKRERMRQDQSGYSGSYPAWTAWRANGPDIEAIKTYSENLSASMNIRRQAE
ncbi:hypothetical protein [Undibacterium crateris]|uniref:hypothetical protein n=1 Tax=Undibacterium crateris TaxID=2528175 RepID=UPI00138A49D6|nr:hypothetical protein [Undibacterium crateris]NDI85280.1 hypothetical protein [Undibacterium crateris]